MIDILQDNLSDYLVETENPASAQLPRRIGKQLLTQEATLTQLELGEEESAYLRAQHQSSFGGLATDVMKLTIQPPGDLWGGVPHEGLGPRYDYDVAVGRVNALTAVDEQPTWVADPTGYRAGDYIRSEAPEGANAYWHTGAVVQGVWPRRLTPDVRLRFPTPFFTVMEAGEQRTLAYEEFSALRAKRAAVDEFICTFHGVQYFSAEVQHDYDDERQEALRKLAGYTMRLDSSVPVSDQTLRMAIKEAEGVGVDALPFVPSLRQVSTRAGMLSEIGMRRRKFELIEKGLHMANEIWEGHKPATPPAMGGTYHAILRHAIVLDQARAVNLAYQIASPASRISALTKLAALENSQKLLDDAQTLIHNEYKGSQRSQQLKIMFLTLHRHQSELADRIFEQLSPLVQFRLGLKLNF